MGTYPNGIFQRLRFLTKAIELVHDVWQMTRVPYEYPLTGPRYWDDARARVDGTPSSRQGRLRTISTMMTDGGNSGLLSGRKVDCGAGVTPSIAYLVAGGERPRTYHSRKAR